MDCTNQLISSIEIKWEDASRYILKNTNCILQFSKKRLPLLSEPISYASRLNDAFLDVEIYRMESLTSSLTKVVLSPHWM